MPDDAQALRDGLSRFYAASLPADAQRHIDDWAVAGEGWETLIYRFMLYRDGHAPQKRVLRVYPATADAPARAEREFALLGRLRAAGYPTPEVYETGLLDGRAFLTMAYAGDETLISAFDASTSSEQLLALFGRFCGLFADLHALDHAIVADLYREFDTNDPLGYVRAWLAHYRAQMQTGPGAALLPVLDWLAARYDSVPCARYTIIHGDYHPNNVLQGPDGALTVIDWSAARVADPRVDVAWTLMLVETYRDTALRDAIQHGYEQATGEPLLKLDFFDVMAACGRLQDLLSSLSEGAEASGMRSEAVDLTRAEAGHFRNVYALLRERTGLALPQVEAALAGLAAPSG